MLLYITDRFMRPSLQFPSSDYIHFLSTTYEIFEQVNFINLTNFTILSRRADYYNVWIYYVYTYLVLYTWHQVGGKAVYRSLYIAMNFRAL